MGTDMERSTRKQQPQLMDYSALFQLSEPIEDRIAKAAARLALMVGQPANAAVLQGWVQRLKSYPPNLLEAAFTRAEGEVAAFPAVAHLKAYLDQAEFDEQFAVILRGIPKHGPEWKDVEESWGPSKFDFSGPERVTIPGKHYPAEPAPAIPPRMVQALGLFGDTGRQRDGITRLYRDHPSTWTGETERKTGQHSRQAALIRRDLFACWLRSA